MLSRRFSLFPFFFLIFYMTDAILSSDYDYIIVGSGSAGAALAYRLSSVPTVKVLLLEAGERPPTMSQIPLFALSLALTECNWNFTTEPSKNMGYGLKERRFRTAAGKALGGTTVLNYNLFVRGNKRDYDDWAANGATDWDWKNVFPYFVKLEDNRELSKILNGYHGIEGNLIVQTPPFHPPVSEGYLESAKEIGYDIGDFNAEPQAVFQYPQGTINKGRRWCAIDAYIDRARGRRNFWIITSAFVVKILIDSDKRAYGVRFEYKGKPYEVFAKHEVIISAGAFNSPKLLLLSGIGPKKTLKKFKIPMIADLPVGENLQEHLSTAGLIFGTKSFTYNFFQLNLFHYTEFLLNGTGPLTSLGAVDAIGFLNSKYNENPNWPDVEILWVTSTAASDGGQVYRVIQNINDDVWKIFEPYMQTDMLSCYPYPLRPKSKGFVSIRSKNPHDDPVIDFNFYSDPYDMKIMLEGLKYCLALASTESMKKFGVYPIPVTLPGCEDYEKFSDDYLVCVAKTYPIQIYHYSGTCKMGDYNDPTTVVDPKLRVKGVKGLRVADASVMPNVISGHTNIPSMMIGEKAADMILHDLHDRSDSNKVKDDVDVNK